MNITHTKETVFKCHTLNARTNFEWLYNANIDSKIIQSHLDILSKKIKPIEYKDLRNLLIPNEKKNEYIFLFNTEPSISYLYSVRYVSEILNSLNKDNSASFLIGDIFFPLPYDGIILPKSQFVFCVFVNNLNDKTFTKINEHLQKTLGTDYFCGIELKYNSYIRNIIFNQLIPFIIKYKNNLIIEEHNKKHFNTNKYNIISLDRDENDINYFSSFLQFKIRINREHKLTKNDNKTLFNIITKQTKIPVILIDKKKKTYFETGAHSTKILTAFNNKINFKLLKQEIQYSIRFSYIYDLKITQNYATNDYYFLFATYININNTNFTVVLEYKPNENKIYVISLY